MVPALRTTIIGGSNTVMQPGYLGQLTAMMAQRGAPLEIVTDLAVGGTTSAYGLYRLKTTEALAASDLLLIEYVINDAFIYGDERRQFRHWARIYEGILRYALACNPKLKICTLILGARNGSWCNSVPSIDAGIHYISSYYGTDCIDMSRLLLRRFGRDVVSDPAFYADQGHYNRPIATGMVADVAAEAMATLAAGSWQQHHSTSLPPAIDPDHFADAEVIDAQALFGIAPDADLVAYNNRRFSLDAVDLSQHDVSLSLDGGKLLGVFHVSTPDTAPLVLHRNEAGYNCSLLKGGVRDGKFKFLASMLPCEFLYGADLLQPVGPEIIRLGHPADPRTLKPHIAKDNIAAEQKPAGSQRLPLMGLMHSGKCLDIRAVRRDGQAVLAAE